MRTVHIDFLNPENPLPDGNILGNQGEHNATILAVTPPAEMTANEEITSYRIAFELTNCRAVRSKAIAKADVISLPIFSQITSSETVAVQLEGYDENGDVIVKSPKIKKFKFNPSVCGVELPPSDSPNSMATEVTANTAFRNKFSEDENGNLLYKGESIVTSESDRPTAELILNSLEGYSTYDKPTSGSFIINDAWYQMSEEDMPLGTEIKKVELSLTGNDDDWIDINDMYTVDGVPYHISVSKVFTDVDGIKAFAMATNLYAGDNYIYNIIANGNDPVYIKITYFID